MADAATAQQGTAGTPDADKGAAATATAATATTTTDKTATTAAATATTATTDATKTGAAATDANKAWFPDDWRQKIAGGDEKYLKRLERYATPADLAKAMREAQDRIAAGEVRTPLPKDATAEQLAAYRKERGIPETPAGYFEKLPEGLVIGETDKAEIEDFAAHMHGSNAPPEFVHAGLAWYNKFAEKQAAAIAERDVTVLKQTEDALRTQWGGEFRINQNGVDTYLQSAIPDEVLRNALGETAKRDPGLASWLVGVARAERPELFSTIIPAGGSLNASSVDNRIAEIEKVMKENRKAYNADPKMQEELRGLYDTRAKLKARAA